MKTDKDKLIDSHIQMPKCVLKRFEAANGKFFYFDVIKDHIGTNGSANSLNTEKGFYSKEIEDFLNRYIEDSFGKLLLCVDQISSDPPQGSIDSVFDYTAKMFAYALAARNPGNIARIISTFQYVDDITQQLLNELGMMFGLFSHTMSSSFAKYGTTIAENRTDIPFVLPTKTSHM